MNKSFAAGATSQISAALARPDLAQVSKSLLQGRGCSAASHAPFNITVTAGFYSTLAGVVAGFAFTALIFLVTARLTAPDHANVFADAIRILLAAFMALVLTSVNYAVAAGDPGTDGRTASEEPILGLSLAVSGVLVIYAIVLTLESADRLVKWPSLADRPVGASARHALALGVAPLLVMYIVLAVQDYENIRYGPCRNIGALDVLGWVLIGTQAICSWIVYPLLVRSGVRAKARSTEMNYATWAGRGALFLTLICAAAFSLTDAYLGASSTLPPIAPAICMFIIFAAMLGMVWLLAYTRPEWKDVKPEITNSIAS